MCGRLFHSGRFGCGAQQHGNGMRAAARVALERTWNGSERESGSTPANALRLREMAAIPAPQRNPGVAVASILRGLATPYAVRCSVFETGQRYVAIRNMHCGLPWCADASDRVELELRCEAGDPGQAREMTLLARPARPGPVIWLSTSSLRRHALGPPDGLPF